MSTKFKGLVEIQNAAANLTIGLDGDHADFAVGGKGQDGDIVIKDNQGKQIIWMRAKTKDVLIGEAHAAITSGNIILFDGKEGDIIVRRKIGGVTREVMKFDASHAALYIGNKDNEGDIIIRNNAGDDTFHFDGNEGDIIVRRKIGGDLREVMKFDASHAALYIGAKGNEGDILVKDGAGKTRIHLDGASGDIKLQGADCAEEFDVVESENVDSSTVLVINDENKLQPCKKPYDKKVVGVVSGGNGYNPGIILDKNPSQNKRLAIALNGKVYCKVDAQYSPIEAGDLLTTSPTDGYAMKASDPSKAFGAVIGKALHPLKKGKHSIPILVALQ